MLILGSNGQGSGAQSPLACVYWDCRRTHDEEPLSLPRFIHADDVVLRRRFASLRSALYLLIYYYYYYAALKRRKSVSCISRRIALGPTSRRVLCVHALTIPDQQVLKEKAKCTSMMSSNQPLLISSTLGRRARRRKYHCCLRRMASDLRLSQLTLVLITTTHGGMARLSWPGRLATPWDSRTSQHKRAHLPTSRIYV